MGLYPELGGNVALTCRSAPGANVGSAAVVALRHQSSSGAVHLDPVTPWACEALRPALANCPPEQYLRERFLQLPGVVGDIAPDDEINNLCFLSGGGSKLPAEVISAAKAESLRYTD